MRSAAGRRRKAVRVVGRGTGDDELDDELLATYRRRYGDLVEAGRPTPSTVPASGASADDPG